MNNIKEERTSSLLGKMILIHVELSKLNSMSRHFAAVGNADRQAAIDDTIQKAEVSKSIMNAEIDRRIPCDEPEHSGEDEIRPSA